MRTRMTREEWTELLALKSESGLTVKAFCESRGVGPHQFYYWRRQLQNEAKKDDSPTFIEVGFEEESTDGILELDLQRLCIRLTPNFCERTLRRVLAITGGIQC